VLLAEDLRRARREVSPLRAELVALVRRRVGQDDISVWRTWRFGNK